MAVTIPNGGYAPRQGQFSPPASVPTINQAFLSAAQASRYSADPVFRKHYYCNVINKCNFGTWLTENMGYATSCFKNYSIIREYPTNNIVHLSNDTTLLVPANGSSTVNLPIAPNSHFVGGAYVYPQVGDGVLLPPDGTIGVITAVNEGVNSTTISVRRQVAGAAVTVPVQSDVIILTGKQLADCSCPTGQMRIEDAPIEQAITMFNLAEKSGPICGDALLACQNVKYEYSYMGEDGCPVMTDVWYGGELTKLYQRHENSKWYRYLFDPTFGIIPTLTAQSIRWNWADPNEVTRADIADLKEGVQTSGINCFEYTFVLGTSAFASIQNLANDLGTGRVSYGAFNPEDCKWINLNFCTISDSGMIIHFYEECNFGDGNGLGARGFDYQNRGIGLPMCDKPSDCKRYGEDDNKMFTIVNFKDIEGNIWDNQVDSNGILNGVGGRNTFGTGCKNHEWSIESDFAVEVACPQAWVLVNFPA